MKYLLLYYDLKDKKYVYRIFGDLDNIKNYKDKLMITGVARTTYIYCLYGKYGGFI